MATSSSVDWTLTSRQIISEALENVSVIAIGDTPDAADAAKALSLLNQLVKTWGTRGYLFQKATGSVTLTASTASYTASPVSLARRVISARRRTGTGTAQSDIPLAVLSREEYEEKSNKLSTGTPVAVFLDPQRATRTLYVWPVPDATIAASTTIQLTYERVIEDLDALDNDTDLPQEWLEALIYGLSARLIIPYDLNVTNPAKAQKIEERAGALVAQLSADSDETASVFFSPA